MTDIVNELMQELHDQGVVVHWYKSVTTSSFYIKLDYGLAYSIRIADHPGKPKYAYKFGLRTDIKEGSTEFLDGHYIVYVYGLDGYKKMVKKIILARDKQLFRYRHNYKEMMENRKRKMFEQKKFKTDWKLFTKRILI